MTGQRLFTTFLSFLAAGVALAQDVTGVVGPPTLQFSFSNPGARSMGLGGSFVALADDATAAFANPAGLVQIVRPEVSVEGRYWGYSTSFTQQGRITGEPTGIGVDVVAGLRSGTSSDDLAGLSFLSFVYPRNKWSIAFYRHQLADFESLTQTQGLFAGGSICCRLVEYRVHTDLEIVSYGLSGAYRVNDSLSLGFSLVYFDGDMELVSEPFLPDEDEILGGFAPTSYLPERMIAQTSLRIDNSDWGFTGGFLWALSPRWRLGGFYREGPGLELRGESVSGPGGFYFDLPAAGTILDTGMSSSAFPDVFGLGCSFRPQDGRLTIAFEWDRVEYSTILDSLDPETFDVNDIVLADGNEYHLGAEYVFIRSTPLLAARLGVWLDPDHRPRATAASEILERAFLQPGKDQIHYALGFGLAFKSFQIDFGADFSDLVDTVSLSAIYGF